MGMDGADLIIAYIKAKKGIEIPGIAEPTTPDQWLLYNDAVNTAARWWLTEGKYAQED